MQSSRTKLRASVSEKVGKFIDIGVFIGRSGVSFVVVDAFPTKMVPELFRR